MAPRSFSAVNKVLGMSGLVLLSVMGNTAMADVAGTAPEAESVVDMLSEGTVSGSLRMRYYTDKNAYFVKDLNQDTAGYGGFVKYETAALNGFKLGGSLIYQRTFNRPDDKGSVIPDIGTNVTNIGEAYVSWEHDAFKITAGNQRVQLPWTSDYDWRVVPVLFQGINVHYGNDDDFLSLARLYRWKGWADDGFSRNSMYSTDEKTAGMWSLGGGRSVTVNGLKYSGQLWRQHYYDYTNVSYGEGHVSAVSGDFRPNAGLQYIRGTGDGRELAGTVDNTTLGFQAGFDYKAYKVALGYDHIKAAPGAYNNGSLVTPYAHNMSSGPYFAQPYFTSTQDLGAGNAYSLDVSTGAVQNLFLGARYSFMDLTAVAGTASLNQSEYLLYGIYNFAGALKGLSVAEWVGIQTSPARDTRFFQNRLEVSYNF